MFEKEILICFDILEVKPESPFKEVKRAYREMAKVWHPDRFPNDPSLQSKGQEKLKQINRAYEKLQVFFENPEAYKVAPGMSPDPQATPSANTQSASTAAAKDYEAACRIKPQNQGAKEGAILSIIYDVLRNYSPSPSCLYLRPNIPQNKLNGAHISYLAPHQMQDLSRVLLLFDTNWEDGSIGLCLTNDGIYWRNACLVPSRDKVNFLRYSDIQYVNISSPSNFIDALFTNPRLIINGLYDVPIVEGHALGGAKYHHVLFKSILDNIVQMQKRV